MALHSSSASEHFTSVVCLGAKSRRQRPQRQPCISIEWNSGGPESRCISLAGIYLEVPMADDERGTRAQKPGVSPVNRSLERGIEILRAFRPGSDLLGNGELAERA